MVRMAANRKLNKLGIDHCEIKLKGCWKRSGLTWAHSVKSRFLVTPEDFLVAARACKWCHTMAPNCIEDRSHAEMKRIVLEAIQNRKTQ